MAFAAGLPAELKVKGSQLRYFFKETLRNFLPQEILAKKKQGFGLPFGVWLESDRGLRELAGDSLISLARRGIFRKEFLDDLSGRRHGEHAAYYGVMIWTLMMLEQWFQANGR